LVEQALYRFFAFARPKVGDNRVIWHGFAVEEPDEIYSFPAGFLYLPGRIEIVSISERANLEQ
jgi:hypothetical protein